MDLRKLSKVADSHNLMRVSRKRISDSELDQLVDQVWDEISGMDEAGGVEAGEIEGLNVDVFINSEEWPEVTISVDGYSRTWNTESFEGTEEELYEEQKEFIREELEKTLDEDSEKFIYDEIDAIDEAARISRELGSEWSSNTDYGFVQWEAEYEDASLAKALLKKAESYKSNIEESFDEVKITNDRSQNMVIITASYEVRD